MAHIVNLYTGELNFEQSIWDKFEMLLGTSWGTFCEFHGNPMGARNYFFKSLSPPPQREKLDAS
jgi:hypothetical protein